MLRYAFQCRHKEWMLLCICIWWWWWVAIIMMPFKLLSMELQLEAVVSDGCPLHFLCRAQSIVYIYSASAVRFSTQTTATHNRSTYQNRLHSHFSHAWNTLQSNLSNDTNRIVDFRFLDFCFSRSFSFYCYWHTQELLHLKPFSFQNIESKNKWILDHFGLSFLKLIILLLIFKLY